MVIAEKFRKPSKWDIGVGRKFARQDGEERTEYLSRMAEVIPAAPGPIGVNVYSLPVREMAREVVDLRAEVVALRAEIEAIHTRLGIA